MSSFLALCKEFRRKAGIAGTGPASVAGQSGEYQRLIDWISRTWLNIQNNPKQWKWMWREYSPLTTISNTSTYVITDVDDIHTSTFTIYKNSIGSTDISSINYIGWAAFKARYGTSNATASRPSVITRKPNGDLSVYPMPDDVYTIEFEYQKNPQILVDNSDVPEMPEEFHELIMFQSLIEYGGFEESSDYYSHASNRVAELTRQLIWSQELHLSQFDVVVPE